MDIFTEERQRDILNILYEEGRVKVDELSKRFKVSGVTIRRDLQILSENYEAIRRTHGGAISLEYKKYFWHGGKKNVTKESKLDDNKTTSSKSIEVNNKYSDIKNNNSIENIIDYTKQLISDSDNIIIEASNFDNAFTEVLSEKKNIKIFTNSLYLTQLETKNRNIEICCSGGLVDKENSSLIGQQVVNFFSNIYVNKAFISIESLKKDSSFYTLSETRKEIKESIFKSSDIVIGFCESKNIDKTLLYKVGSLELFDIVVLNKDINKDFLEILNANSKRTDIQTV